MPVVLMALVAAHMIFMMHLATNQAQRLPTVGRRTRTEAFPLCDPLEGVPERAVRDALLIHRVVALEHASRPEPIA